MSKAWYMPNKNTFTINPILELINKYISRDLFGIDPFANNNKIATLTNDIDIQCTSDYHMDALDWLKTFNDNELDYVLFDPPYSPRQVSECYRAVNKTVNMKTTQASYWGNLKKEISRIVKSGGFVITCAWNSGGIGKSLGFYTNEILLVAHGGWHNDTIVTVEFKREGVVEV